jgi:hypothetical protein
MAQIFNWVIFWVILASEIFIIVAIYLMVRSFRKELRIYRANRDHEMLIKIEKIMKMEGGK